MRVIVLHHSLNRVGGAERVCISTIEALQNVGHKVLLATTERTDWRRVNRAFGKTLKAMECSLLPIEFKLRAFGIYQNLLAKVMSYRFRKVADLVINTCSVPYLGADVTYLHFPTFAKPSAYTKYRRNIAWRFYFAPYGLMDEFLLKKFVKTTPIILTNSRYTANVIKKNLQREAVVIHPPVDTSAFFCPLPAPKSNLVLTVGRITKEKGFEIVPKIARLRPKVKFVIAGSTSHAPEESREVIREIKRQDVVNLEIVVDISLGKLKNLYRRARVYLHTTVDEHFGISIVEAMAAGCIPLVHKSGGPWIDIVQQGKWGFGYETVEEAAVCINHLMNSEDKLHALAQRRSRHFTEDDFKRRMLKILECFD